MDADGPFAPFAIPTPCPMDWDRMTGDDRVRFCERCGKHVYDFTAMGPDERSSLTSRVLSDCEELCGRLYRRPDGTLVASECPSEPDPAAGSRPITIRSVMAAFLSRTSAASEYETEGVKSTGARQFTIRWLMTLIAACATALGITRSWLLSPDNPAPAPPMSRSFPIIMGKMMPRRLPTPSTNAPSCPPTATPPSGVSG